MAAGTRDVRSYSTAAASLGNSFVVTKDLDMADVVTVKGSAIENGEVAQLIDIKKGTFVHGVSLEVLDAGAGTTLTCAVGDGSSTAGFVAASDAKAAVGTVYGPAQITLSEGTPNTYVPAYAGGKLYDADDTLDVLIGYNTVSKLAKVRVTAICSRVKA